MIVKTAAEMRKHEFFSDHKVQTLDRNYRLLRGQEVLDIEYETRLMVKFHNLKRYKKEGWDCDDRAKLFWVMSAAVLGVEGAAAGVGFARVSVTNGKTKHWLNPCFMENGSVVIMDNLSPRTLPKDTIYYKTLL